MLYYALFYATAMPTVVYAQVIGDENDQSASGSSMDDDTIMDSMIDLADLPWLDDEPISKSMIPIAIEL